MSITAPIVSGQDKRLKKRLSIWGMPPGADPILSRVEDHLIVHLQRHDGHTPNSSQSFDADAGGVPGEMITPLLPARMKERDNLS
jgi:hypothetical protein